MQQSSPRTWGCFLFRKALTMAIEVFPTHVGVFLSSVARCWSSGSLPHARGGVSDILAQVRALKVSSPRTWGCFSEEQAVVASVDVFPTHVGVFPCWS